MNSSKNVPSGNTLVNLLKALGNGILMLVVAPFMFVNEARLALKEKVYNGFDGAIRAAIGGLLGFAAGGSSGYYLGWSLAWPSAAWIGAGVAAWFAAYWFAWPLAYLLAVKPAINAAELVWQAFHRVTKKYADTVFGGIIRSVAGVLPGSASAWSKVEAKKDNWVTRLILGLSYPVSLAAGVYTGWASFQSVSAYLGAGWFGPLAGLAAGVFSGLVLVAFIWQCLEEGKLPFVALALGFGLDRLFSPDLAEIAAFAGYPLAVHALIHLAVVTVFIWYAFPFAHLLLSGGLIKWLLEQLKPLNEKAYDDRDKEYVVFFHNAGTIVASALAVWAASAFLEGLLLPVWACMLALVIVAAVAYVWIYDIVDHGGGTFITGLATALYSGGAASLSYTSWGHGGGIWIAIPLGILVTLLVAFLLFPAAYLFIKPVLVRTRISKLGAPLARLHSEVEKALHKLSKQLMKVYDASYGDRGSYQNWFLHASNLGLSAAIVLGLGSFASLLPGILGTIAGFALSKYVLAALSYILVGKFLQKSGIGCEFVGGISSLAFAVTACSLTLAAGSSWPALLIVGVFAWAAAFALLFPAAYLLLRLPARYLLASWSAVILSRVHDFVWSCFSFVWDGFLSIYRLLAATVFRPFIAAISAAGRKVSAIYRRLKDKIKGKS